ncbi:Protein of uncharacterised function DUF115 [Enterobacter hormaechei]|uniref:hypothetical protein n=1 Tax=Enterobacter hormaechei TaxID=158836 RepID=UPI001258374F|nr:hypothetical protein [Enterobacter hormaechei]MCU4097901.1 hypothetical protein [Enterobacter hormaechei subsp. steigerwaltii]MCU4097958.1 hypothetical protein [Enterobacter hormaechei subsp. steigerwaltii]VAG56033.1 Protein of uncharacterised function DUF115 [Enterobacter hormaechei]
MKTVICIGSGPSLMISDCRLVIASELSVIAVNSSWRAAPLCQHIYAADCCWWEEYGSGITSAAARWCGDEFTARRFGINWLPSAIPGSFNSGQRAIELAIHLGASRVLLLGYDCSIRNGTHWHDNHALLSNPDKFSVARWQEEFSRLRAIAGDVEIINCSRFTRLTCFPRQSLETALSL